MAVVVSFNVKSSDSTVIKMIYDAVGEDDVNESERRTAENGSAVHGGGGCVSVRRFFRLRIISNSGQIWSCLGSGQQRVRVMVWFNSGLNSGQIWSRGILFNRLMGFGSSQFSMVRVFGLSQLG
ncbi:hypothetical protein Hanom_Chr00s109126g01806991 [Helianthus anomalus]